MDPISIPSKHVDLLFIQDRTSFKFWNSKNLLISKEDKSLKTSNTDWPYFKNVTKKNKKHFLVIQINCTKFIVAFSIKTNKSLLNL